MLITTKATKRAATRVAAVALTATALCGLGSVAAFADTPTSGALPLGQVTNLTPYTWTLDNSEVPNQSYAVDPPKSLAPATPTSTTQWRATFAVAPLMFASAKRFMKQPKP